MAASSTTPIIVPAQTAVLLCFLPTTLPRENTMKWVGTSVRDADAADRSVRAMNALVQRLQQQFSASMRVLKIDELVHPEVVRSFNVHELPAFVVVRQGVELGRREGAQTLDDVAILAHWVQQLAQ